MKTLEFHKIAHFRGSGKSNFGLQPFFGAYRLFARQVSDKEKIGYVVEILKMSFLSLLRGHFAVILNYFTFNFVRVRAEKNDCITRGKRLISNWQEVGEPFHDQRKSKRFTEMVFLNF